MNTYSESLLEIDESLLAQMNRYVATDVQYLRIDDNNQKQYSSNFVNWDNINIAPNVLNKCYHFSEQIAIYNYEVTLDIENGTFKQANVNDVYDFVEANGNAVADATAVTGANTVSHTKTTAVGARYPSTKAFRLKGSHHLVDYCQFDLGSQPISRNTSQTNLLIEQNLKKMNRDEYEKVSDLLCYTIDDPDAYEVSAVGAVYVEQSNKPINEQSKRVLKGTQDRLTASTLKTILGNGVLDYQERCYLKSQTDTQMVFNCYTAIPLKYVHDSIGKIPSLLSINGYRLITQLNIGGSNSWSVTYAQYNPLALADVDYYDIASVTSNQSIGKTCPFLLSKASPHPSIGDLVMIPNAGNVNMKVTISAQINPTSGQPCRIYIPTTIYNDLSFIRNESKARILYDDIYTDSILNVASGDTAEKTFNFSIPRMRYLFIFPQLSKASCNSFQNPVLNAPVCVSPNRISGLQVEIGGTPIYVLPIQMGWQFYEMYNQFMGSDRDGNNLKSSDQCGLVTRDMYDLNYGVIVVDLKRVLNENLDSLRKQLHISFRNDSGVDMNYFLMVSSQNEITLDRVLCSIVKPT